jgi:hypothetical protein
MERRCNDILTYLASSQQNSNHRIVLDVVNSVYHACPEIAHRSTEGLGPKVHETQMKQSRRFEEDIRRLTGKPEDDEENEGASSSSNGRPAKRRKL